MSPPAPVMAQPPSSEPPDAPKISSRMSLTGLRSESIAQAGWCSICRLEEVVPQQYHQWISPAVQYVFKLAGVWLSDFVDGGDGASGDGAQERRCLDGLVGQAADANLAEDQATLEAAILAIAVSSGDTSAAMLLKVYRYEMS